MGETLEPKRIVIPQYYSETTAALIQLLENGKVGDELTDDQLQAATGRDCSPKGSGYGCLGSAKRYCIKHKNIRWIRIPGAGKIKVASAEENIESAESALTATKRRVRRAVQSLSISQEQGGDLTKINTLKAQLGTIGMMADKSVTKALTSRAAEPLDRKALLGAWLKDKKKD